MEFIDLSFDRKLHLGFRLSRYGVKEPMAPDFPRDYPVRADEGFPVISRLAVEIALHGGKLLSYPTRNFATLARL